MRERPKDRIMIRIEQGSCQASISPQRGAIVTSLKVHGEELLYLDQATFDDPTKNVRGGIPVLFPICGPLPETKYDWGGSSFSMKQHGFAREQEWKVVEQNPDRLVLELTDSEVTRAQYPFSFCYRLIFQALSEGLKIGQTIKNLGDEAMPLQFGFHPYFLVGDKEALELTLPVTRYSDNKSEARGDFPGFDFSSEEIDWAFPEPTASEAGFQDPSRNLRIKLSYDEIYQVLVFWTLKGSPFVCLEPWSSSRLAFPLGPDLHHLAAGETLRASMRVAAD